MVLTRLAFFFWVLPAVAGPFGNEKFSSKYDIYFRKYAKRYFAHRLDWTWFKAQAIAESNLDHEARSTANATGIMQILPRTYASIKREKSHFGALTEPRWNIAAGIFYNRKLWNYWQADRPYGDKIAFMFASYNAGPATIFRAQKVCRKHGLNENRWSSVVKIAKRVPKWRERETLRYIKKIFRLRRSIYYGAGDASSSSSKKR